VTHAAASELEAIDRIGVLLKGVAPVGPTGSGGPAQVSPDLSPVAWPEAPVARPRDAARPVRRYSPGVQRLAEEYGVDLSLVTGTGMGGRVSRKDVQEYVDSTRGARAAADTQEPGPDEARVPLTPVRRIIAENMIKSASQIPQAWSITEVDVTNLVQRRELAVADVQSREGVNLTYLPFVLQAVAAALLENPLLNSSWGGDCIVMKRRVNLGIPEGLVVPVIRDAESLSIVGLARVVDDLTSRARQGKLVLEDVRGGTFTVNNTGVLGSVASQPLVNPPQAAIMTTEAIVRRPVVMGDAIVIRSMMNLCLTFDHRVMDGADVGAFTTAVKRRLEAIGPDAAIY
jgi:2-oxoisovalerate dehydrogenase E2 component (dihydrolipoyl transacylase)